MQYDCQPANFFFNLKSKNKFSRGTGFTFRILFALIVPDELALRQGEAVERVVDGHSQTVDFNKVQVVRDDQLKWEVTS